MSVPDAVVDLLLAGIATGTRVSWCTGEPANFAGIAAVSKVDVVVTPGDGNGDFTIEAGDTSGRQILLEEQADMAPNADGTITYMAIDDGANLLATNPITSQAVTTLQTWTFPQTKIVEYKDPTYS